MARTALRLGLIVVLGALAVLTGLSVGSPRARHVSAAATDATRPLLPVLGPAQACLAGDSFEDNDLHGWTSQNTSVFELRAGGPSPSGTYIHAKDGSGASTVSAPDTYGGNWISRTGGCGTFCFDVNLFNDGEPTSAGVAANFYLYSGGSIAQFLAYTVSEPGGPNPGWHRVCAPIRTAAGGSPRFESAGD